MNPEFLDGYALPGDEATNERLVDATPAAMFEELATPNP
jgi:hypothetical protein